MSYTIDLDEVQLRAGSTYEIKRLECNTLHAERTVFQKVNWELELYNSNDQMISVCSNCSASGIGLWSAAADGDIKFTKEKGVYEENLGRYVFALEGKLVINCVGQEDHKKSVRLRPRIVISKDK